MLGERVFCRKQAREISNGNAINVISYYQQNVCNREKMFHLLIKITLNMTDGLFYFQSGEYEDRLSMSFYRRDSSFGDDFHVRHGLILPLKMTDFLLVCSSNIRLSARSFSS